MTLPRVSALALILLVMSLTAGCEAIADIFQAGMWVGIVLVVLVVGGILALVGRLRR